MRNLGLVASVVFALSLLSQSALAADKRVALVIGNSAYQNVVKLANPANDAAAMTETLKTANFDIVEARRDLKATEMRRALRDFADKARDADVALVYFAGHGIEVDGTNYLIPVDALLERDTDVYDEAFSLERILVTIEPARKLRLVILDACRDNPFVKNMKRTTASRAITRGLAKVEPASPNTLIAYSAKAGSTALDGDSKNSPFTAALVRHIATPGLDLRKAFGFIRDDVMKNTSNRQEPYVYGSLGGDDVPLVPVAALATSPAVSVQAETRRDYELALQLATRDGWNAFLTQHPDGFYASLAKSQLAKLAAEDAHTAAAEKARLAVEEKARLAAEGARKAEQTKAAADAKTAEDARIAAEKLKTAEQERAAAGERARAAAEARVDAGKLDTPAAGPQLATLPAPTADVSQTPAPADLPRQVQVELQRVGCLQGSVDNTWTAASRKSIERFNRYASTRFDAKAASTDALEAIKAKSARVCPLVCAHGSEADGDRCVKIVCRAGTFLNDDNECEKKRNRNEAKRNAPRRERDELDRPQIQARSPRAQPSGQIVCDNAGCRPVRPGCRLVSRDMRIGLTNVEVCN
ncbi:caspase family protein [Tardiphaga sp. 215_C5_N2_1]|uniref:caspase family protein n=1 Tax=Tardiphaga sp. 215_C5_N2_1 TaxID=3240774 RepID=UPI003F8959B7